ncbi:hypothetical protein TNCV_3432451 [Trichonephila clavipes]|nr:hypothetical protein TNCV_3432451 [Trichonephila clavipes]
MNGTPVGKQDKWQFLVPVLLVTGYQEREAVQDGSIEPLYHAVRLRIQSCCPGFVDGEYFTQSCKLQNRNFFLDRSALVEGSRIMRSSFELKPLQQLRPLGREKDRLQAT